MTRDRHIFFLVTGKYTFSVSIHLALCEVLKSLSEVLWPALHSYHHCVRILHSHTFASPLCGLVDLQHNLTEGLG